MGCCYSTKADESEVTCVPFEKPKIKKLSKSLKIISLNILAQHLIDGECPGY
jgi:hypothetical protein